MTDRAIKAALLVIGIGLCANAAVTVLSFRTLQNIEIQDNNSAVTDIRHVVCLQDSAYNGFCNN